MCSGGSSRLCWEFRVAFLLIERIFNQKSVRVKRLVGSLFLRFGIRVAFCFFVLLLRLNLNDKDVVGRSASSIKHLFPGASNGSRRPAFQGKERPNRGIEEI